jgi:hypothetical protein
MDMMGDFERPSLVYAVAVVRIVAQRLRQLIGRLVDI